MCKAYCSAKVFQKLILISPTADTDLKYQQLPLTETYTEYSDDLLDDLINQQNADIMNWKDTDKQIKLYKKYMKKPNVR